MDVRQYIGARYVTKIYENSLDPSSAEWEAGVTYEPLTLVTYLNSSYLSKKDVPGSVGNPAANPDYWVVTGAYNGQIVTLQNQVNSILNKIDASYLADNSKIITVAKNGGGMFTTINDAVTAARSICSVTDRVVIFIGPGAYSEEINLLENPGIDLIGIGDPQIIYASIYPESPLHTTGDGYFKGLTFIALDSATPSYGLHIDAQENLTPAAANIVFENCTFISYNQTGVGLGLGTDFTLEFRSCAFTSAVGTAFFCHNYPGNAANQTIRLYDCDFFSAVNNADIYVTDACLEAGGNISDSYFNIAVCGGSGSTGKVVLKNGGTLYPYFIDNATNLVTGISSSTRAFPGADYFLRTRSFHTDVYFTGQYAAMPCIDEFPRSYTVTGINPLDALPVTVNATVNGQTIELTAPGWSGGPIRLMITGTIDF